MNTIILNALAAAGAATGSGIIGYLGNIRKQEFDGWKFFQTVLIGVVGGGLVGALSNDWRLAIAAALGADDIRGAMMKFTKK